MAERRRKAARGSAGPAAAAPATEDPDARLRELSAAVRRWSGMEGLTGIGSGVLAMVLVNQAWRSAATATSADELSRLAGQAAAEETLAGIGPRDAAEGLLAAQMVATHEAAMECFRRANLDGQTFEGRQANLGQANKLVRSYAALLEVLDRHRGKGQPQVVRVERVTVEAGGQAIVGAVTRGEGGVEQEATNDPMQRRWPMHRSAAAGRGRGPGARAGRPRCGAGGGAGCTAGRRVAARRRATGTRPGTAAARPGRWRCGGWRHGWSARPASWSRRSVERRPVGDRGGFRGRYARERPLGTAANTWPAPASPAAPVR
jgi:hypothetical protein